MNRYSVLYFSLVGSILGVFWTYAFLYHDFFGAGMITVLLAAKHFAKDEGEDEKYIVFLDMDGVLADFDGAISSGVEWDPPEMFEPGFFRNLKVMPGAKEAVAQLLAQDDLEVYIGSKPTSKNRLSATEKMDWINEHFPELVRNMVLVCDKKLLRGDILIDDDKERWGHVFEGRFIHFDRKNPEKAWAEITKDLCR